MSRRLTSSTPARLASFLLVLAALLGTSLLGAALLAGPASADSVVDAAVAALQQSPVYNSPAASPRMTDSETAQLTSEIQAGSTPIYVAVLPASVLASYNNDPTQVIEAIQKGLGANGTFAVVAGRNLKVGNNQGNTEVAALADQAVAQNQGGSVYSVLSTFVTLVENAASGSGSGSGGSGSGTSGSGGSSNGSLVPILGVLVVGAGGIALLARRSSSQARQRAAATLAEVRPAFEEDVTKLGEDIKALDLDIDSPKTTDEMRQHYAAALNAYDKSKATLEAATNTLGLHPVSGALEEGHFELACVTALQAGQPLPERRAPCFFNPQHGPSVQDVTWTPPGGTAREVPACADCASRVARGVDVDAKTVNVGGQQTPYWNAGPQYVGYAGGYYGGFGSILPGLLIGTLLGSSLGGHGYGYGGFGGFGGGGG
ncbi:MAG TPA: hypothetical protein VIJ54_10165, partial [Actinomycetes bacterium]